MVRLTIVAILISCLTNCSTSDNKPVAADKLISPPKPDKDLRETKESQQNAPLSSCVFDNPDTSLSNIRLRDAESATTVLKIKRLNGDTTYNFNTSDKKEILSVTVHPGDNYNQISIFHVKYATKETFNAASLPINHFTTEKHIKLGLTKNQVVAKLGHCYSISDTTKKSITINYRLESPQKSTTKLLERQNMPIYYGTYIFRNDKLVEFEFGFVYP